MNAKFNLSPDIYFDDIEFYLISLIYSKIYIRERWILNKYKTIIFTSYPNINAKLYSIMDLFWENILEYKDIYNTNDEK